MEQRALIKIPKGQLYDTSKYLVEKGKCKVDTTLRHTLLVDPASQDVPQYFYGAYIRSATKPVGAPLIATVNQTGSAGTGANIDIRPSGNFVWEIEALSALTDDTAARKLILGFTNGTNTVILGYATGFDITQAIETQVLPNWWDGTNMEPIINQPALIDNTTYLNIAMPTLVDTKTLHLYYKYRVVGA